MSRHNGRSSMKVLIRQGTCSSVDTEESFTGLSPIKTPCPDVTAKESDPSFRATEVAINLPLEEERKREVWRSKAEFLLSVIGFAVDLGNVWRFPYICYKNGGGAFLVPYIIMVVFFGVPLFYLELALGQFQRTGCITVWRRICPILGGIGFCICVINMYVSFFYNTVIAWSVYYLFSSFTSSLPWTTCDNYWNTANCSNPYEDNHTTQHWVSSASEFFERKVLGAHLSTGIEDVGTVKWDLALCLLSVYIVVYFSIWRGIRTSGKVVWVTATLPYFCLLVLLLRGVSLPGAGDGIVYYLWPRWELLGHSNVWMDAAVQVFFSLGPGFGVLLALASYNESHNNCYRDALFASLINCVTSFVSGFAIFAVLGYMALKQDTDIEHVATDGPGLIFVAFPEAIATLPGSNLWAIIFFVMLISLGLDSTFGGLESIITAFSDAFPKTVGARREIFVACLISCCFLGSLSTVTYGGQYVFTLLESFGASVNLLLVVVLEAIAVTWCYGVRRFCDDIRTMLGFAPGIYWVICWQFLCPSALLFIVIFANTHYEPPSFNGYQYPDWAISLGWCMTTSSVMWIPLFALYKLVTAKGNCMQRLFSAIHPEAKPTTRPQHHQNEVTYI
ncbi:sodium-dependent serotonin transporter-like [Amphiura filiformis]|uniref:sodium-dependent serotonin transporter-like n=1 Tax=Amphiura filiformis TaxID=82378 RepID=UPI003B227742